MRAFDLREYADGGRQGSLSNHLRERRFARFKGLIATLPTPVRILDIGGTVGFWEQRGWCGEAHPEITLVNLATENSQYPNIRSVRGDATNLDQFGNASFDVAFSNSVIEHLFTFENQRAMGAEVRRVATAYWVQTPNFWFPIEPHFHVPGWHWMPEHLRIGILRRHRCGWRGPCPDIEEAKRAVREVRLMTQRELQRCFPDATMWPERFGGLVKSWVAYGGFGARGGGGSAAT